MTFVASGTVASAAGAGNVAPSKTGVAAGNLLGVLCFWWSTTQAAVPTPAGWTIGYSSVGHGSAGAGYSGTAIFFLPNAPSGTNSVTLALPNGTSYAYAAVGEWSGYGPSISVNVLALNAGGTNALSGSVGPTGTTTQATALALGVLSEDDGGTNALGITLPTGYTNIFVNNETSSTIAGRMCFKELTATGTETTAYSWTPGAPAGTQASVLWDATLVIVAASASGTNVTPGVASVALTGYAPTVVRTANQSVSPGVGALTLTGYSPTVSQPIAVSPGVGALAITGFAPTVAQTLNQSLTPGAAALALTGYAPTISQPQAVSPGAAAIAITGYAPSIAQPIAVAPGAAALALTGYAPTVAQTANQAITPAVGSLTLTGFAPTVTQASASISLSPGAAVLTITGYAPTVTGTPPATFPGFEVDQQRPRAPRRLPERSVKPMLVRAMERRLQNVKPSKERAAVRAKAIEFEAAALVLDGATQREIAPLLQQWEAQRPYIPPQLSDMPTLDVFLSQIGFRIEQAQAQKAALDMIATERRQDEDALLALMLA